MSYAQPVVLEVLYGSPAASGSEVRFVAGRNALLVALIAHTSYGIGTSSLWAQARLER
jgi:hypothetical protein